MKNANSNANSSFRPDVPGWYFLKEFSLGEFMSGHDRRDKLKDGYLFQAVWKLGVSPEWVENIEMTLAGSAKEALEHYKLGKLESPGRIRIFCQKKMIDDGYSEKFSRPDHSEGVIKPGQTMHRSDTKMHGGCGYFVIERSLSPCADSSGAPPYFIDLYLYQEGE